MLLLIGCLSTKPAPDDIDGLAHFVWQNFDDGSDADLRGAIDNLNVAFAGENLPMTGTISDLSADEQALVAMQDPEDPSLAAGIFVANPVDCTFDQIERITIELDQASLYPGTYDAYERVYTSDDAQYLSRETATLTWESSIDATVLGAAYHEDIYGGVRYVQDDAGDVLIARVWLPSPAVFEGEGKSFTQDYQLEVYWVENGQLFHFYPLWRRMDYGGGLDTDDASVQSLMLDALLDWDKANEGLCQDGF